MRKHNLFQLDKVFQGEQGRGVITSISSGIIANVFVYMGKNMMGMSIETSAAVFGLLFGNIIGYFADIMFAKQNFDISGKIVQLPFNAFAIKFKWLIKSLISKSFFRFWIIVFIDMIMTITIVGYLTKYFNYSSLLMYKWRDSAIVLGFAIVSFLVYVNPLRFTWAYNSHEDPTMNMLILMWFTISILIYVSMKSQTMDISSSNEKRIETEKIIETETEKEKEKKPNLISELIIKDMLKGNKPSPTKSNTVMSDGKFETSTITPVIQKNVNVEQITGLDEFDQKYQMLDQSSTNILPFQN